MRVFGPAELAGLMGRTLCLLPSEKLICLDEIQTLISKLEGGELLEAVKQSLQSPLQFDEATSLPHFEIVLWKIKVAKSRHDSENWNRAQLFACSASEVHSALAELQEDGYLGLRCFLSDALICRNTESIMAILWKHIVNLPAEAQLRLGKHAFALNEL